MKNETVGVTGFEGAIGAGSEHNREVSKRIMRALGATQGEPAEVQLQAIRQETITMRKEQDGR